MMWLNNVDFIIAKIKNITIPLMILLPKIENNIDILNFGIFFRTSIKELIETKIEEIRVAKVKPITPIYFDKIIFSV